MPCRSVRRPGDPDAPSHPGDQTVGITDGADLTGWTYSVYLQDEWKVLPTLTVNFGLRFDAITGTISENQLSPRINVVWEPTPEITPARRLCPLLRPAAA